MNLIKGLSDKPKQETTIMLADGTRATLLLEYRPNQRGWFYDISHEDFAVKGLRLVASPNILRTYRNLIPFGLAVITTGAVEPLRQADFVDGTISMLLLDAAEVAEIETTIFPGN